MSSREKILTAVAANQPGHVALPDISLLMMPQTALKERLTETLTATGSLVIPVKNYGEVTDFIAKRFPYGRIATAIPALEMNFNAADLMVTKGYDFQDVELAVIRGHFAVAENGALWVTEENMIHRALPFITQHLAIIINSDSIIANMHEAYSRIGNSEYGFGTFISGPSKTADIEQALVIGAHGARSLICFITPDNLSDTY